MSPPADPRDRCRRHCWRWALVLLAAPAGAQTIADYSHAQRAAIEAAMTQAAARAAASSSTVHAPPAASAPALPPEVASRHRGADGEPAIQVGGVFATVSRGLAEVSVDGRAYLLAVGQAVPGTPWRVETIVADRVVLSRGGAALSASPGAAPARRSFVLPALH